MAYLDESGTIMIDEVAAESDISKLNSARASLENVRSYLTQISALNGSLSGPTSVAIEDSINRFSRYIDIQIQNIDVCVGNIQQTVSKYQSLDESLKNTINSTL